CCTYQQGSRTAFRRSKSIRKSRIRCRRSTGRTARAGFAGTTRPLASSGRRPRRAPWRCAIGPIPTSRCRSACLMPPRTDSIDITAGHASLVMVLRRSLLILVLLSLPVATGGCRHSAAAAVPGDNGHEPPVADAQGGPLPTSPVTLSGYGTYLVDR